MLTRIGLALLWLLHWLPYSWLAACGRGFGGLLYRLGRERRRVALTNLGLCFPDLDAAERSALARRHFAAFGRSFVERALLWWASPARIRRHVRLVGIEHLTALRGQPAILLAPHFLGLDAGWTRLTMEVDMVSIYANQKNPSFNAALQRGRLRFGAAELLSRQEGTRRALKALKAGKPFYYLPDLDYGPRDAIFVPFFGVPAATITGLSRLARMSGAKVLPAIARMDDAGYVVAIGAPWEGFPGETVEADTRRMNAFIEAEIRPMPEQYFWLHKRFKTRPPGEKKPY